MYTHIHSSGEISTLDAPRGRSRGSRCARGRRATPTCNSISNELACIQDKQSTYIIVITLRV